MDLICEERLSDSPYVERVWRNRSERAGTFISMAETHYNMVVSRHQGTITMTVRGPESRASPAHLPADAEWTGIVFRHGTFMSHMPALMVMNRRDLSLPPASGQSFWLQGAAWQFPDYDNVETFVDWLARDGLLVRDSIVDAVLQQQPVSLSLRTLQRRFVQATGLTQGSIYQIQRAREATSLLRQGMSILDTVDALGYYDQAHLTRSLRHLIGQTPTQIARGAEPLSFLYKTGPSC